MHIHDDPLTTYDDLTTSVRYYINDKTKMVVQPLGHDVDLAQGLYKRWSGLPHASSVQGVLAGCSAQRSLVWALPALSGVDPWVWRSDPRPSDGTAVWGELRRLRPAATSQHADMHLALFCHCSSPPWSLPCPFCPTRPFLRLIWHFALPALLTLQLALHTLHLTTATS